MYLSKLNTNNPLPLFRVGHSVAIAFPSFCRIANLALLIAIVLMSFSCQRSALEHHPSKTIATPQYTLHYVRHGEGSNAVLFVHGFGCDLRVWEEQYRYFKDDTSLSLLFVDLPGYGASTLRNAKVSDTLLTLDFFADALHTLLLAEHISHCTLVGHSLGTPVCRQFCFRYPEESKALCDVDGVYCFYPLDTVSLTPNQKAEADQYCQEVQSFAECFKGDSVSQFIADFARSLVGPDTPKKISRYALSTMPLTSSDVAYSTMHNLVNPRYWTGAMITVPTLVFCTQNSGLTPDNQLRMQNLYLTLTYHELTTTGHFIQWEEPELFNHELESLIKRK